MALSRYMIAKVLVIIGEFGLTLKRRRGYNIIVVAFLFDLRLILLSSWHLLEVFTLGWFYQIESYGVCG